MLEELFNDKEGENNFNSFEIPAQNCAEVWGKYQGRWMAKH